MMKKSKKVLFKLVLVVFVLGFLSVLIIKSNNIGSTSQVSGEIRNINNRTIVVNADFFVHDYVHIMLGSTKSDKIEDGLKFDVINPKGEQVTSGKLYDDQVFREDYKNISGEWKIVLHFEDNESSSFINFGFAVNSSDENTMKIE